MPIWQTSGQGNGAGEIVSFTARSPSGSQIGNMVYISGPRIGNIYYVDLCDIVDENTMPSVGMIVNFLGSNRCIIQTVGKIEGLHSNLIPGKPLFLGPGNGANLIQPPISRPVSGSKFVQQAGIALSNNIFWLSMEQPTEMVSF